MTIWVDVEDLFDYALDKRRPSGIQRIAFELSRALSEQYGESGLVRFVRHDSPRDSFREIAWSEIAAVFGRLAEAEVEPEPAVRPRTGIAPHSPIRQAVRLRVHRLPARLRGQVIETMVAQERAWRAWISLFGALGGGLARMPRRLAARLRHWATQRSAPGSAAPDRALQEGGFDKAAAPGDTLLAVGAPWSHPDYAALIRKQRARRGLRFALLVHDIIALRHPEWCEQAVVRLARAFFDSSLPLCDQVFAMSRATADDVTAYAGERGIRLAGSVEAIPVGTGFECMFPAAETARPSHAPPAGDYALFVSTIEVRKNHLLLFRVWRQLLEDLPPEKVPTLVFAGRVGWLVDDLMRQISNSNNLNGKLVIIENSTDSELAALYRGCRFTLFPSFHEGWGLPVSESLAFGKPCLIADRSSLPEAGGPLVRRFDPDNLHDAYAAIRAVIMDPAGLDQWAETIRRDFQPVPWSRSAEAFVKALTPREPAVVDVVPLESLPAEAAGGS